MKVSLIRHDKDALDLLLMTKNTRLSDISNPAEWSEEKRMEHLEYMRDTIKSSWEFVDYVFKIENVSRAFTHQLVRTRSGHYAQESQRAVDVSDHGVVEPDGIPTELLPLWEKAVMSVMVNYREMLDSGLDFQDARGILPTNIETSIIAKFDLRTLHNMGLVRLCVRTQGEYQKVFRGMRRLVIEAHHWTEDFLQPQCGFNGTCAFPKYGKKSCPFYNPRMDLSSLAKDVREKFWGSEIVRAVPVARNGKTM